MINEVDSDTPGTDTLEFVELYDGGAGDTALDGFSVVFYNGNGDVSYSVFDLDGLATDADGYFVLGNAGVADVDLVFGATDSRTVLMRWRCIPAMPEISRMEPP